MNTDFTSTAKSSERPFCGQPICAKVWRLRMNCHDIPGGLNTSENKLCCTSAREALMKAIGE